MFRLAPLLGAAATVLLAAPPRTLRLDYVHLGTAAGERFALDGVTQEGAWPGAPGREIDDMNSGKYYFEVIGRKTNRIPYSRGFDSIYGEWETTNVWAIDAPAARSGVSRLSDGVWRRSPIGAAYDSFGSERYVLAFEGALYEARGYYRAQPDCVMFTRNPVGFCAVCRRAIERVIALYAPAR